MSEEKSLVEYFENQPFTSDALLMRNFFPPQIKWFSRGVNSIYRISPVIAYRMTMLALSFSARRRLKEKDRVFYAKGKKRTFRCKRKTIHTYSYGEGPEVYFVHGWVSYGARWKLYVDEIVALGFQAVVIDAPAHGTSPGMFLSLPDYVLALKHVFNNAKNMHAVINHSIGSLCSIVALKESMINKPCKIGLLSSFNTAEALLNKFARSIGIREHIIDDILTWIPRYAGYDISHLNVSRHLESMYAEILLIYDRDDLIVPSIEPMNLLNANKNINYYPTFGLGHNLKSPEIIRQVVNFIAN
jgi:hypothetical protein